MREITRSTELVAFLDLERRSGRRIALVPTMGALHAGHESLIARASQLCTTVVVSLFVNPLQFGSPEDLSSYPRRTSADLEIAASAGASVCFVPEVDEMYPNGVAEVVVEPGALGTDLEGAARPGHFTGVATIVTKLFALIAPSVAFFGEKDYQQLAIVRRLVGDLSFPLEVVGCATVRASDGLALSSRNERLSPAERAAAPVLYRALLAGRDAINAGSTPHGSEEVMRALLSSEPFVETDYAVCRDAETLKDPTGSTNAFRLLVAAHIGEVRLIDNLGVLR